MTVTGPGGTLDGNKEVAVRFLGHFWAGELEAALALAAPDAVFVNTRSLAEQRRVPLHQALSWIIGDLFSRNSWSNKADDNIVQPAEVLAARK